MTGFITVHCTCCVTQFGTQTLQVRVTGGHSHPPHGEQQLPHQFVGGQPHPHEAAQLGRGRSSQWPWSTHTE
jgi:hypothetical protein